MRKRARRERRRKRASSKYSRFSVSIFHSKANTVNGPLQLLFSGQHPHTVSETTPNPGAGSREIQSRRSEVVTVTKELLGNRVITHVLKLFSCIRCILFRSWRETTPD